MKRITGFWVLSGFLASTVQEHPAYPFTSFYFTLLGSDALPTKILRGERVATTPLLCQFSGFSQPGSTTRELSSC